MELATNKERRAALSEEILSKTELLFEQQQAVEEWDKFLSLAANLAELRVNYQYQIAMSEDTMEAQNSPPS